MPGWAPTCRGSSRTARSSSSFSRPLGQLQPQACLLKPPSHTCQATAPHCQTLGSTGQPQTLPLEESWVARQGVSTPGHSQRRGRREQLNAQTAFQPLANSSSCLSLPSRISPSPSAPPSLPQGHSKVQTQTGQSPAVHFHSQVGWPTSRPVVSATWPSCSSGLSAPPPRPRRALQDPATPEYPRHPERGRGLRLHSFGACCFLSLECPSPFSFGVSSYTFFKVKSCVLKSQQPCSSSSPTTFLRRFLPSSREEAELVGPAGLAEGSRVWPDVSPCIEPRHGAISVSPQQSQPHSPPRGPRVPFSLLPPVCRLILH